MIMVAKTCMFSTHVDLRHLSVVYSTTGGNQCMLEKKIIIWNRIKIPKIAPLSKYK
jgi:hypothetical protein